jgi:hypothetical protein
MDLDMEKGYTETPLEIPSIKGNGKTTNLFLLLDIFIFLENTHEL